MAHVCGKCGVGVNFKAKLIRPAVIDLSTEEVLIKQEGQKFVYEVVQCAQCNEKITNEDLLEAVVCPDCNTLVAKDKMINGICDSCETAKNRPDLMNLTPEEYIKKIIELEKALKSNKSSRIEEKVEDAKDVEQKIEDKENKKKTTGKGKQKAAAQEDVKDKEPVDVPESAATEDVIPVEEVTIEIHSGDIEPPQFGNDEVF